MRFGIYNEYDPLEAVLVHRPGPEVERLTPDNMRRFLFEDMPHLRRMREEHDAFTEAMRGRGVTVYYLEDLLRAVLADELVRWALVAEVCAFAAAPGLVEDLSSTRYWNTSTLVDVLFAGLTLGEYHEATGRPLPVNTDPEDFVLPPIPNAYFSRDPAVVVGDTAVSCKMHYVERVRETQITRCVLENHPDFSDNPITYGGTDEPTEDRPFTIEGGDVLILSAEAVLVGVSERTRSETIARLATKCFQAGSVRRLYEIPIPAERAFMHLDTVFTIVDRGTVLWYAPVMERVGPVDRYEPAGLPDPPALGGTVRASDRSMWPGCVRVTDKRSLPDILRDEFGCGLSIIRTAGGRRPFDAREQRSDGTNAVAIAPRLVISYNRNERTNEALAAAGIEFIGVDGSELVRGLGGPRCMTMPLRRGTRSR